MHFGIEDLIGVLLVAFSPYQTYELMKSSGTLAIFNGIVLFIAAWILISQMLEMRLMGAILNKFISIGFVVLVILFQDEIRRFLLALGSHRGWKSLGKLSSKRGDDPEGEGKLITPAVLTCMSMVRKKTGALVVVQQDIDLTIYEHMGEMFNADTNARLIENIFFKNSLLHDGVMIIADNRIKAAGCISPTVQNTILPRGMGLRHRPGLGISLETDTLVIIVSRERGKISVTHKDKLSVNMTVEELRQVLSGEREVTNCC